MVKHLLLDDDRDLIPSTHIILSLLVYYFGVSVQTEKTTLNSLLPL